MSAFQVDAIHIAAIVRYALGGGPHARHPYWNGRPMTHESAVDISTALAQANADSLTARYPSDRCDPVPVILNLSSAPELSAVECAKAIDCFEYQACEFDGWETSAAHDWLAQLRKCILSRLPGYDAADCWPIYSDFTDRKRAAALAKVSYLRAVD